MSSLTAQNEGASSEHLHACSNTLSPHNTNAWPLTAPMLAVLTDTGLLVGHHSDELQDVLVRLRGERLSRGLRTRPPAGASVQDHRLPSEHARQHPPAALC